MAQDGPKPSDQDPAAAGMGDPAPAMPEAEAEAALQAAQEAVSNLQQSVGAGASAEAKSAARDAVRAALNQAKMGGGPLPTPPGTDAAPFEPQAFDRPTRSEATAGIDLLSDVNLNVKIELGRTRMLVEDVLKLTEGAVVELDKLAGDPVDVYVNERHIARGEVLVLNDNFCVRINEIVQQGGGEPVARKKA